MFFFLLLFVLNFIRSTFSMVVIISFDEFLSLLFFVDFIANIFLIRALVTNVISAQCSLLLSSLRLHLYECSAILRYVLRD